MVEQESRPTRKTAVRQRPGAAEKPRPVLSFRVHADLHARLRASAESSGYAMSEEVERRLMRSFELEEQVATLTEFRDLVNERDARLWPDEPSKLLGAAFAMILAEAQQRLGKSWRESEVVAAVVSDSAKALMLQHCRRSLFEGLTSSQDIDEAAAAVSASVGSFLDRCMPALPEPKLDVAQWTARSRLITVFRDKETGDVLETVTGPEFDASDPHGWPEPTPDLRAALDRYRPRQQFVSIEVSLSYSMNDGSSVWESLSHPEVAEAGFRVSAPRVQTEVMPRKDTDDPPGASNDVEIAASKRKALR